MKATLNLTVVFDADLTVDEIVEGVIDSLSDHRWGKAPFAIWKDTEITMLPDEGCAVTGKPWEPGDTDGRT